MSSTGYFSCKQSVKAQTLMFEGLWWKSGLFYFCFLIWRMRWANASYFLDTKMVLEELGWAAFWFVHYHQKLQHLNLLSPSTTARCICCCCCCCCVFCFEMYVSFYEFCGKLSMAVFMVCIPLLYCAQYIAQLNDSYFANYNKGHENLEYIPGKLWLSFWKSSFNYLFDKKV